MEGHAGATVNHGEGVELSVKVLRELPSFKAFLKSELADRENEISSTEHHAEHRWNSWSILLGMEECDNHDLS